MSEEPSPFTALLNDDIKEPNAFIPANDDIEEDCEEIDCDDALELDKVEADESNLENVKIEGKTWINLDIVPVKKITCFIPKKLFKAIQDIENCVNRKFSRKNEFSIYIRGEMGEDGVLNVCEDYYIPKQKVGTASVDYLEEPQPYYNGCLHKHPDGCMSFSGTDEKYINSNFEFSLLYVKQKIHMGIINIKYIGNRRVQVPLNIKMEGEQYDDVNIDNIILDTPPAKISPLANTTVNFDGSRNVPTPAIIPGFEHHDIYPSSGMDVKPHVVMPPTIEDVYELLGNTI